MELGKIRVRIVGFEKYNPKRSDQKTFKWFRLENRFVQSESLYGVPLEVMTVFFILSGLAQERDSEVIEFDAAWFCNVWAGGQVSEELLYRALDLLNGKTVEIIDRGTDPGTARIQPVPAAARYERTNDTNDTYTPTRKRPRKDWPPEIESAYASYPRKDGKTAGMKILVRDLAPEDYPLLLAAVNAYAKKVRDEKTEKRFVKHWSTFAGVWRDWLEPDAGTCETGPKERVYDFGESA